MFPNAIEQAENVQETEAQLNLDNDDLFVIETLQYGAYDVLNATAGTCSNCNCNSNCNGSSEEPLG
jgi:hypothetical protein